MDGARLDLALPALGERRAGEAAVFGVRQDLAVTQLHTLAARRRTHRPGAKSRHVAMDGARAFVALLRAIQRGARVATELGLHLDDTHAVRHAVTASRTARLPDAPGMHLAVHGALYDLALARLR